MLQLQYDEWLSKFLGKPAYHLQSPPEDFYLSDSLEKDAFIGVKVPADNIIGLMNLQKHEFLVVDMNIQLSRKADFLPPTGHRIRPAKPEDETAVKELARISFVHNRFHHDPQISKTVASRIKETWAGNYFTGNRGEWMFVAEKNKQPVGFLLLLRKNETEIIIDLVAVAENYRGNGIAKAMITHAAMFCLNEPATILVGTQIANIASLNLYASLGFKIISTSYVLHLHKKAAAP